MLVWLKGLSVTGKIVTGLISVATISAIASANPKQPDAQTAKPDTVQAQQENKTETKTITEAESIAFTKTTLDDGTLEKGKTQVRVAGVNGIKTKTYELTLEDGKEKGRKLVKEEVTTQPVSEVIATGTYVAPVSRVSNCDPNYTPCVPNVPYDLDCADIGFSVTVIGNDHHNFDGNDNDGYGCESY